MISKQEQDNLLEQYKEGNREALNTLIEGVSHYVKGALRRRISQDEVFWSQQGLGGEQLDREFDFTLQDEILQETWVRAIRYAHTCEHSFATWVIQIHMDYALREFRQKIKKEDVVQNYNIPDSLHYYDDVEASVGLEEKTPEEVYSSSSDAKKLARFMMQTLSPEEKEFYIAHHVDGENYSEIAERTGICYNEVYKIIDNANHKVKRRVEEYSIQQEEAENE